MRVAVTGAGGFVGRWLVRELVGAGHEVVGAAHGPDVTDAGAVAAWLADARPDAVAHLAAVSSSGAAAADPGRALAVNVGGTINVTEACGSMPARPTVLVSGSAEVYGTPAASELPLTEDAVLRPVGAYAQSKAAAEGVALELGRRRGVGVIVTRAFNHTGAGQAAAFACPAIAARVADVAAGRSDSIRVGNLDVARDFLDVRDVVRAYRLLLEAADRGGPAEGLVINIGSGRAVTIRWIVARLCALAGVDAPLVVDPTLVRPGEASEIRGDASRLRALVGWAPEHELDETLADVLAAATASSA